MQQKYGFIMFDNIKEFENWLKSQNVTRKINRLQVHHMGMPDYSCWKTDEHFRRQNNIKSFHKNTNGWSDIAQHFSIFPDGKIMTGRNLNLSPVGITGWNTGAICVEIYGNFDKGKDIMTAEQRESVLAFYSIACKVFNLPVNSTHIKPHAWFTSGGTCLGTYKAGQSRKTCPGTNFMGYGNTKEAFEKFYAEIKNYQLGSNTQTQNTPLKFKNGSYEGKKARVTANTLNVRSGRGTNNSVIGTLKKGQIVDLSYCLNDWISIPFKGGKGGMGYINVNYIEGI